jgi:hypothetical protein
MKSALASIDLCIRMFKADYEPGHRPQGDVRQNPAVLPKGSGSRARDILGKPEGFQRRNSLA